MRATRILLGLVVAAAVLAALLLVRTFALSSSREPVAPAPRVELDEAALAANLAAALRLETVSHEGGARLEAAAFERFHAWLAATYPRLHAGLERELVGGHSLLYTWRGAEPELAPLLLLAHQDVVPADPARWTHPPFAGLIDEDFVWGRGALDDKGGLVAICEAVERLAAGGFAPRRTLLLAFGHDEEVGGRRGAVAIAGLLAERGVRPELVLDEGMAVLEGVIPGLEVPTALIGVAEKGSATLELVVEGAGGHSSTPPRHTAAGLLASAVHRVEAQPMPGGVDGVVAWQLERLAPAMPFHLRVPLANLWLFGGLLERVLGGQPAMNAMLRTTTAVTMLEGSPKQNVLPQRASARINFRIRPGDTSEDVMRHVRRAVDDPRVELAFTGPPREASPVSPSDGTAYELLARTIRETFPDAIVAPGLVVAGTDARHYTGVSPNVYRFRPFVFGPDALTRIHGVDERVAIADLATAVRFYLRLLESGLK